MLSGLRVVSRHEVRVLANDPLPIVVTVAMPVLIAAFVKPMFQVIAVGEGHSGATGAENAVPSMTVMFGFFLTGIVGVAFFHEHRWNTWDRLRSEALRPFELVVGKILPYVGLGILYQVVVLLSGVVLLGLRIEGPMVLLPFVVVPLALMFVCFAFALVAVCRSVRQLQAYSNLSALLFAGLAGAITPLFLLPSWAQAIAPLTPGYWGVQGLTSVVVDVDPVANSVRCGAALLVFSVAFAGIGFSRFHVSDRKIYAS